MNSLPERAAPASRPIRCHPLRNEANALRLALVALACVLASACASAPEPTNPLADASLLPSTSFRGMVRRDQSIAIPPVVDHRADHGGAPGLVDRRISIPATDVVRGLLGRQLSLAGLFSSVRLEEPRDSDLVLNAELIDFDARDTGITTLPTAHATVELRVKVTTRAGEPVLEKRYVQRRSQDGSMVTRPDALALGCDALAGAVDELLVDLDRIDFGARAAAR